MIHILILNNNKGVNTMYGNPYGSMLAQYYMMQRQMNSNVRFFHASPDAPAADVYVNDNIVIKNIPFKELSSYLPVPTGNYNVKIYPAGTKNNAIVDTMVYIPEKAVYTIAAVGKVPDISLYPIQEPISPNRSGVSCVRFIHLSSDASAMDVIFPDDSVTFSNVPFKGISSYACTQPGTYTFRITPSGTSDSATTVSDTPLDANTFYTLYLVGMPEENSILDAVLVSELK